VSLSQDLSNWQPCNPFKPSYYVLWYQTAKKSLGSPLFFSGFHTLLMKHITTCLQYTNID